MTHKHIEMWADSFHEGNWACEQLSKVIESEGGTFKLSYKSGFIPFYEFTTPRYSFDVIVYGSYRSWSPLPQKIADLLDWGKPDFVAYSPSEDKILFAVEETAATPTGNQALQRCERLFGASHSQIPFWYLLSEYGNHIDGGVRRDSIWPTVMSLKLTAHSKVPSIVLHYSDIDRPEDYDAGAGLKSLFKGLSKLVENHCTNNASFHSMETILHDQYHNMMNFVHSQWNNMIDFLPGEDHLLNPDIPLSFASAAAGVTTKNIPDDFLVWPLRSDLPEDIIKKQEARSLIKYDNLAEKLEQDIFTGRAYYLSNKTGSRPQPKSSIEGWIKSQKRIFDTNPIDSSLPPAIFTLNPDAFPETESGNFHLTTSKNILYLYDKFSDLASSIETAFPRLAGRIPNELSNFPAMLYISNSLQPGRIFGDPFTGQIAAFSVNFGKYDPIERKVIAYFSHQVHGQVMDFLNGKKKGNKGLILMSELTDYLLFSDGVLISLRNKSVI